MRTWKIALTVVVLFVIIALVFLVVLPSLAIVSLPTWLTPEVAISTVALLGGAISTIIAFKASRPGLKVEVRRCAHYVRKARVEKDIVGTQLSVKFWIKNRGEKTTIYTIELSCESFESEMKHFEAKDVVTSAFVIEKGWTLPFKHSFFVRDHGLFEKQLKCTFWLYHTYGKKKVKTESNRVG